MASRWDALKPPPPPAAETRRRPTCGKSWNDDDDTRRGPRRAARSLVRGSSLVRAGCRKFSHSPHSHSQGRRDYLRETAGTAETTVYWHNSTTNCAKSVYKRLKQTPGTMLVLSPWPSLWGTTTRGCPPKRRRKRCTPSFCPHWNSNIPPRRLQPGTEHP